MRRTADVVIIGGGIQGLSLAYHLTRRGIHDVCLIEMNSLGSGSSGRSAAIIGHAFQSERCLPLTQWSYAALMRFQEEMGASPDYALIGCLLLAGREQVATLRQRHARLEQLGIESHLVGPEEIEHLTPGLNLEDVELGMYNPQEGCIDPHCLMMAYANHARRGGAELVEGLRVTGLRLEGDRVTGVHTGQGTIESGCVVNAAGFCAREVGRWAGLELPITNLKRHLFFTGPVPAYPRPIPFTYDMGASWYMRREGPGLLIGMGAVESDEEDPQVDWPFLDTVIEHSLYRAPALAEAGIKTAWAGLRPVTPDDDPILGPTAGLIGFWNDCGWGGHGIMHAPAAGAALAEWIADGQPMTLDLGAFGAERFAARTSP